MNALIESGNIESARAVSWWTVWQPAARTSQVSRPSSPATHSRPRKISCSSSGMRGRTTFVRYAAVRPERQGTAPRRDSAGT